MIALKVTTEYSILKSLIKLPDLIAFLVKEKIPACGICDDELFGMMEFYLKCQENNIKPIIGLDIVLENLHYYLYPKNYLGYQKLLKINSLKYDGKLTYENLTDENILIIIPYQSIAKYQEFKMKDNLYIGYFTPEEKRNAFLISNRVVYVHDVKTLSKKDIPYLKYLKMLNDSLEYTEFDYYNQNVAADDLKTVIDFCKQINLKLEFGKKYIPVFKENISSFDYLSKLAHHGLVKRCNGIVPNGYLNRLEEELKVIEEMGFVDYFLIVYDYVLYAKKNNILVGPGRGSAAGSLVSYAIGITNIDPVKYDLLFARFLNPSRKKMPDIDIDFEDSRRPEIIEYVRKRYGQNNVALGITFNSLKSKLVLRDVAKIMKIDNSLLEKFIKTINGSKSLNSNLQNEDVKKYLKLYPELNELYDVSMHLENLKKNSSTHAAGVVISSQALDNIIPVYKENDIIRTGIAMEYLEQIGLLKMDFLGLRNLSIIGSVVSKIPSFKIEDIPLDDAKTYRLFQEAETDDIFQFESSYAKQNLLKLKVNSFAQLALAIALVRPGPSNQIDTYIQNKNNSSFKIHPALVPILSETSGVIIFQEQVMKILEVIGGYTAYEADNVRIAMSKKKQAIIDSEKERFLTSGVKNGYDKAFVQDLFEQICRFAEYGFNKAHSVSYALIAYQMAYLKANYPVEFTTSLLRFTKDASDKKRHLNFLKRLGLKILKPNINFSSNEYQYKNKSLLLPLNAIRGLTENVCKELIQRRDNRYEDIFDFCLKCYDLLNEKLYRTLVLSGALSSFGYNMKTLINNMDVIFNYAELNDVYAEKPILQIEEEYLDAEKREFETEFYGFYIGNHPCSIYPNVVKANRVKDFLFKNIEMILLVEKINVIKTKKNEKMAFVNASDETGNVDVTLFPETFACLPDIKVGDLIYIKGKSSKRFDKYQIIVNNIKRKNS